MVITLVVALFAAIAWIVISLAAGIGLGRMMARAESEDGRVPSLVSSGANSTVASL